MKYISLPVTAFAQNCSLVWCEHSLEAAFIDPGGNTEQLIALAKQQGVKPVAIWLTHGHLDHVGGSQQLAAHYQVPIIGPHQADAYWLEGLPIQSKQFGFPHHDAFLPQQWLQHGDTLTLGQQTFEVRHTPGHTPGHVVIYHAESGVVFVGDVLFANSIGRTDFPGGNHAHLMQSIHEQLWTLPDPTVVVPGHGPNTTIGRERYSNPYVE